MFTNAETMPLAHLRLGLQEQRVQLERQELLEQLELLVLLLELLVLLVLELELLLELLELLELLLLELLLLELLLLELLLVLEQAARRKKWSRHRYQRSMHSSHMVQPLGSCRQLRIRKQRLRWQPRKHMRCNRLRLVLVHKLELGQERCS